MSKKIYSIILGNNDSLFGAINDAKIIYNILYNFYQNKNWGKPYLLLNNNVNFFRLKDIIFKLNNPEIILIYFSGHSNNNGNLKFYGQYISNIDLLSKIDNLLKNKIDLYIIIDSCYSEKFTHISNKIFNNFNIIYFLTSSLENQTSKEFIITYDEELFKNIPLKKLKHQKIPISIFTYYLSIYFKNINILEDIENIIIKKKIWFIINKKYNQMLFFYKYYSSQ
jgi:hypothetical protein